MATNLPPAPIRDPIDHYTWEEWFRQLRERANSSITSVSWGSIDFTGSNITSILTRDHNSLTTIQGGTSAEYYHLTSSEYTGTGSGDFVRKTAPTFVTNITNPITIGGTAAGSSLELRSTSGTGTSDYVKITVGNNGNTEGLRVVTGGQVVLGHTSAIAGVSSQLEKFQQIGTDGPTSSFGGHRYSNDASSYTIRTYKSRSASIGTETVINSGDKLSSIVGYGYDGAAYSPAGEIKIESDGTPGTSDMPGRIILSTTTDGAASVTERFRIDNKGNVIINTAAISTSATDGFLYLPTCAGAPSGTPTSYSGRVATVYDTTNNKLYIYNGAWKSVTLT